MRVYSSAEVHAALPWPRLVAAIEAAFIAGATVPQRHAHALSTEDTLLLMPAWNDELLITKLVTVIPAAARTFQPTVQASVLAIHRGSGEPLALLDGEALTLRRTAATSALAARHLALADAHTLLIVGSGRLAGWMARAHAALRPGLARVLIWGRRAESAQALAATLAAEGLPAQAAGDLQTAVQAAQIVSCATTSLEPIVRGDWLAPGTHLDLVGGFRPTMREVDDAAVQRARVVVDTYAGALAEAGELTQTMARGLITRGHVLAELAELLRDAQLGLPPLRRSARELTLFKSVGTAIEDLAAAACVLSAAPQAGPPQ